MLAAETAFPSRRTTALRGNQLLIRGKSVHDQNNSIAA
jgi:hypothetical protein